MPPASFHVDACLFDMDGTLTDSINAVEAAWARVAEEIGRDPAEIIALTHGRRAIDNLAELKNVCEEEMDEAVEKFEHSILYYADAFHKWRRRMPSSAVSTPALDTSSGSSAPSSGPPSRQPSSTGHSDPIRPGFVSRLSDMLIATARELEEKGLVEGEACLQVNEGNSTPFEELQEWQLEAAAVDRSVKILPGVRRMLASIPAGRYAVATSGAQTYAYGCMTRVGITPPSVTITADDPRLQAGKPSPDPFLLAAACLGFEAKNCVVFEDSPSGIRAGVASGATVIAVCTSHERSQIENYGAHYVVEDMERVTCQVVGQGENMKLKFTILEN
ncbi:HAD-like protein [Roridomyces roridus]|uniref:HAD-like protein n=1 Tax=Roridomyces roridus TaxID=1738132 RepID=A0AAD7BWK9_9AGAR|nr:HAD-like protein [Roridomyces roridus]